MGILICITALPPVDANVVKQQIEAVASHKRGFFKPTVGAAKGSAQNLLFGRSANGTITIIYPKGFDDCDEASQRLSTALNGAAFSFKIDNGDSWWAYKLYVNGVEVDRFSPWERYFAEEELDKSGKLYQGNPQVVVGNWRSAVVGDIERYYGFRSAKDCSRKAYPTDQFSQCDEWQIVDFMKKLGLTYPVDSEGRAQGEEYTFQWGVR
jgi:hypothetical protein